MNVWEKLGLLMIMAGTFLSGRVDGWMESVLGGIRFAGILLFMLGDRIKFWQ